MHTTYRNPKTSKKLTFQVFEKNLKSLGFEIKFYSPVFTPAFAVEERDMAAYDVDSCEPFTGCCLSLVFIAEVIANR